MQRRLAPSILSADFSALGQAAELVKQAEMLHVDVMDGHFVPNITVGPAVVAALRRVTGLCLDVHLMIAQPSRYLSAFLGAGADILNLHVEAETHGKLHEALGRIRAAGCRPALTLKPATPVEAILPFVTEVDMVLLMTVEPGFGGQALLPSARRKIPAMRALLDAHNPACELEVDGGVTLRNARTLIAEGANILVSGSEIFGARDIPARVEEFLREINGR